MIGIAKFALGIGAGSGDEEQGWGGNGLLRDARAQNGIIT